MFLKKFDHFLKKTFGKLGHHIAENTGYYVIVPLLVTVIAATGFQRIHYEDDPEYLFAPTNGPARHERAVVEEFFSINYTYDFDPTRQTRNGRFARFIMDAKDNGTILREDLWTDIMLIDDMVRNLTVVYEGKKYRYSELCAVWNEKCFGNSILDIGELLPQVNNKSMNLTYPFMLNPNTFESYVFPYHFGGVEVSDGGTIESVRAITIFYFVKAGTETEDLLGYQWELEVLKAFKTLDMKYLRMAFFTSRTLETELEDNTNSVVPYFGVTIGLMIFFCLMSVTMGDCVRSKTWLGLVGVLCAALSCVTAFGFLIYLGVPFIGINMAAPFLMLGIGIDDTFVMLAAWQRTTLQDPVHKRLSHAYSDAAVSITITSVTDMISFFIGAITPFPSVRIFCIYTGFAVLMTYLWHITLFGAFVAYAGKAEKSNRHAITCRPVKPVSESKTKTLGYRLFCSGGISQTDPYAHADNSKHAVMLFFRDYVATFLNKPMVKVFVLFCFGVYFSGALYGCTQVKEGLERRKLSRYDSYSVLYYDMEETYFKDFPYRLQVVISGDYNYSDVKTQEAMLGFLEKVESLHHIEGELYTESWLRSWTRFVERNGDYLNISVATEKDFIENLKEYYLQGAGNNFALDVALNEEGTKIVASRFIVQATAVLQADTDRQLMEAVRKLADESPLNATIFHPFFIFFDQFSLIRTMSIQTIALAAVVMMVVSLIFIPNPLCSLWVAFSIVSIEIGVIGYMALWDVNLDSISMIQLIMCIGFSVDFSAHISYAYLAADVDTPDERVRECLYALGLPIVQGGLSTILGILPLIIAPSYIFITFFKTVFLVIFFGATHGIFLLPVLLSLLGPGSCSKKNRNKAALHDAHATNKELGLSTESSDSKISYSLTPPDVPMNGMKMHQTVEKKQKSKQKHAPHVPASQVNDGYIPEEYMAEELKQSERRGEYFENWHSEPYPGGRNPDNQHFEEYLQYPRRAINQSKNRSPRH